MFHTESKFPARSCSKSLGSKVDSHACHACLSFTVCVRVSLVGVAQRLYHVNNIQRCELSEPRCARARALLRGGGSNFSANTSGSDPMITINVMNLDSFKSVANKKVTIRAKNKYSGTPLKRPPLGPRILAGVALTQGSYKPRPLKRPFGSAACRLQILLKLSCLWLLRLTQDRIVGGAGRRFVLTGII